MCTWDTEMKWFHCCLQPIPEEDAPDLVDVPPKVVVHHHFDSLLVLGNAKYS